MSALRRVTTDDTRNWLGLARHMSYGAILPVAVVLGSHAKQLDRPEALIGLFDPRPFNVVLGAAAKVMACDVGAIVALADLPDLASKCNPKAISAFLSLQGEHAGPFGAMLAVMAIEPSGTFVSKKADRKREVERRGRICSRYGSAASELNVQCVSSTRA